jgi:FMNH2-dependent dimethyl sulfone monooxygenase
MAETPASPLEFPDSPLARIMQQPLLLGLFLPIQSGGWSPSSLPRSTSWEFDYNARLTRRAEALGFDLAFGLAQWMEKAAPAEPSGFASNRSTRSSPRPRSP